MLCTLRDQDGCFFSGDGRCDSPGHNAKYLTYSFFDQCTRKVTAFSVTQVNEAGNSNAMEKVGFKKVLSQLKDEGVQIQQLTTDRHVQVRKYLREHETEINHQFDIWHFNKSIRSKLSQVARKSSCKELNDWIKSICNHFWWACATCEGNEQLLREKWTSIVFHVPNRHQRTGN